MEKFSQILMFLRAMFRNPLFGILTIFATYKTLKISNKKYPQNHHKGGRGSAFRHSLWCCLIMMYCCKISSPQKVLKWCKNITDLYEKIVSDKTIFYMMNLHNNQLGIDIFMDKLKGIHRQFFETLLFTEELFLQSQKACIITSDKDIQDGKIVIVKDID